MNKSFQYIFIVYLASHILYLNANDSTYISSNNIIYDEKNNIIELAKGSKINLGNNSNLLIDRGIIDYNQDKVEIFGNFYLYENLNILSGVDLLGDTELKNFNAYEVSYIYNNDLKIDSKEMVRENNEVFFYNNFLTPCKLDGYFNCPTWSLKIDKTKYDIAKDQFFHSNSFLQIADYKVFYLPYFSHYGAKAPRKKGFLNPSYEFTLGDNQNQSVTTPYYIPIGLTTDILFSPKLSLTNGYKISDQYELSTILNNKNSKGNTYAEIENIKNKDNSNVNSSIRINTKQVINKNNVFSAAGLFTNSVSTTRSDNDDPISFEDIFLRLESYDFLNKNSYLKSEISTVENFDASTSNNIPLVPELTYIDHHVNKNFILSNQIDLGILKRDDSTNKIPSESLSINFQNDFMQYKSLDKFIFNNKLILINSFNDYYFNKNPNLDGRSYKSSIFASSDLDFKSYNNSTPRLKFIIPLHLYNNNKNINEDSESITFNYHNQFNENRFFGNDVKDTSPRVTYGIEQAINLPNQTIYIKLNQSYETNKNSNYANKINQKSNFSDYSLESKLAYKNINFQIDARINEKDISRKEMNYTLKLTNPIDIDISYNETEADAFIDKSNDTKNLIIGLNKSINNNISLFYGTNLDAKNEYDPYKSNFKVSLFDECSRLEVNYTNIRFNDNYNTTPEEKISFIYYMDYLGFFGYEQSTDLFFKEEGEFIRGQ